MKILITLLILVASFLAWGRVLNQRSDKEAKEAREWRETPWLYLGGV